MRENEAGHHKLAELLIEREVITSDDVAAVLGERKWKSRQDELIEDNEKVAAQKAEQTAAASETPADEAGTETKPQPEPQAGDGQSVDKD